MDTPSPLFQLALLLSLLGCAAFFICARTVLFGLNRYRLRHRARQGHRAAARLIALLDQPQRLSATLRIGTICSTMAASVTATLLALRHGTTGTLAPSPFILTLAVLMLAHPLGRVLAIMPPPLFAYPASWPLTLVSSALSPLTRLLLVIGQALRRAIGKPAEGNEPHDAPSLTELRAALQADDLPLPDERRAMLLGVLELDNVSVDDIMIPRHEITGIDLLSSTPLLEQIRAASHTRLPVYRNNLNQTEGILHMRRLAGRSELNEATLLQACDAPYFVPQSTTLANQLVSFQQHKYRTAVVVDEYGEAMGIVTVEDILEEIVGDLSSVETAHPREFHSLGDGTWSIQGSAYLREVNRALGWQLPVDGPKTVNGLVTELLENIPDCAVCLQVGRYRLEIVQASGSRVLEVRAWEAQQH
ncbi:HlyC/CorC family transporter [Phytopseudomonas punonensis]|uniref:Mg2+ and Co2+ transporter CorB, contains DUF21, CBS pair, and CorC-HlyC domains n=1 Tax=Phytopseudomonas punonensis TaxID=1220495 RepID=A0A1M7K3G0_9GAMM|nr:CNNM domain-containing protein [Pseudomonas punonensis]SHM59806.1 Mg2+ and Co2+ transporter CorB, contains DUF21, CBS pair, and CorC-HlyC domains [Pseudomonas punonensis]